MKDNASNAGRTKMSWSIVHRRAGLTLVDVIAMIVAVAILASMLAAARGAMRCGPEEAWCANNLRRLGVAFHAYAGDHNSAIPQFPSGVNDNGTFRYTADEWFWIYCPYLRGSQFPFLRFDPRQPKVTDRRELHRLGDELPVFDCPTTAHPTAFHHPDAAWGNANVLQNFDYLLMAHASRHVSLLDALETDSAFLMDHIDARGAAEITGDATRSEIFAGASNLPGAHGRTFVLTHYPFRIEKKGYLPGIHHRGGANILFPDGRVGWHPRTHYAQFLDLDTTTTNYHVGE